nr:hypothetical protein [Natronococcus sp. AD5]
MLADLLSESYEADLEESWENERTARYADDGTPVLKSTHTITDPVYALRSMGYVDVGTPGTPSSGRRLDIMTAISIVYVNLYTKI